MILSTEGTSACSFPRVENSLIFIMKFGAGVRYLPLECIKCWLTEGARGGGVTKCHPKMNAQETHSKGRQGQNT